MRVLAIEPFYGGSHKSFLDGWRRHSEHEFHLLKLPAYKWKWRMRHSAVTFSSQLHSPHYERQAWDLLWVSDMLNLAEFNGLAPAAIQRLPRVAYFHENQLTYPVLEPQQRDLHFAFTNFTTALAADQVWFNSAFHRDDFLEAMANLLARMPDQNPRSEMRSIRRKSHVQHPGIEPVTHTEHRIPGPLRICWNARWEHDKNPETFFAAIGRLKDMGVPFRLIVLGQSFGAIPPIFAHSRTEFEAEIEQWGYAETCMEYRQWLSRADVVVSTAKHEFFGIGIIEAMSAGAIPLLPRRLAYPGVLDSMELQHSDFTYDGSVDELVTGLLDITRCFQETRIAERRAEMRRAAGTFAWAERARKLDRALSDARSAAG